MRFVPLLLAALALAACPKKDAPPDEPVDTPEPEPEPVPEPAPSSPTSDEMDAHFAWALRAQVAVISGDLDEAKRAHAALRDEEAAHTPDPWLPLMADVKAAASAGAEAESLVAAATAVAEVGRACGECHTATGGGPAPEATASPEWTPDHEMLRHAWAANMMWLGLTTPSDAEWVAGAEALAGEDHAGGTALPEDVAERFGSIEASVHEAAAAAATTEDPEERATRYAEIVSMCATCHALAQAAD